MPGHDATPGPSHVGSRRGMAGAGGMAGRTSAWQGRGAWQGARLHGHRVEEPRVHEQGEGARHAVDQVLLLHLACLDGGADVAAEPPAAAGVHVACRDGRNVHITQPIIRNNKESAYKAVNDTE